MDRQLISCGPRPAWIHSLPPTDLPSTDRQSVFIDSGRVNHRKTLDIIRELGDNNCSETGLQPILSRPTDGRTVCYISRTIIAGPPVSHRAASHIRILQRRCRASVRPLDPCSAAALYASPVAVPTHLPQLELRRSSFSRLEYSLEPRVE